MIRLAVVLVNNETADYGGETPPVGSRRKSMFNFKNLTISSMLALALPATALAADHIDAPATIGEAAADITDIYAWMNQDAAKLNLVMNVSPFASANTKFSNAVQYVFHVNSSKGYGEAQTETLAVCEFPAADQIQCWIGDEYVTGNPNNVNGLMSESGRIKIFAGVRNDPFFMELGGFLKTVDTVIAAAPSLTFDENSCPALDADTSAALVGLLQTNPEDGGPAKDTLAGANVLSLVIQVDKKLLNQGGDILSVWGSTHRAQ